MKPVHSAHLACIAALACAAPLPAQTSASGSLPAPAQAAATGTITGRIYNPVTREYVRSAEIRIPGTNLSTVSESGGHYVLPQVPAGPATITVEFTGYSPQSATIDVPAGRSVVQDFEITSTEARAAGAGDAVRMTEFVVSSEREGNAKAIMEQRRSMNIANIVASDLFGDVAEGNVAEFMKYLPGVDIEYVGHDSRNIRMHGMDPQYSSVTINGMRMASADVFAHFNGSPNTTAGDVSRSFGFEQVSINSIEAVEVFKTTGSDMDADSPAGTINLKTKRAFDRKGRRVAWQVNAMMNSEEFRLSKDYGPDDRKRYKLYPGGILDYSDSFFNNRLGIVFNVSESQMYNEQRRIEHTINRSTTPGDTRPAVITGISFLDAPRVTERFSASLGTDFKATDNLVLSLNLMYNFNEANPFNRTLSFNAAADNTSATGRATVGGNGITSISTTPAGGASRSVTVVGGSRVTKIGRGGTITPRFEYKTGPWQIDGGGGYSVSVSRFRGLGGTAVSNLQSNALTGIDFRAERSDMTATDWKVFQTGGPDWTDMSLYRNPRVAEDVRDGKNQSFVGEVNVRYTLPTRFPAWLKTGAKRALQVFDFHNTGPLYNRTYVGPGGGAAGSWAGSPSPRRFEMGSTGAEFFSLGGGREPTFPNTLLVTDLMRQNPEYFVSNVTPANWLSANVTSNKDYEEEITAAYLMGNARLGKWSLQAGLRWEDTGTRSLEFDPRLRAEVIAAGYTVGNDGRATTIDGLAYQYFSKPRITREGGYDHLFPSVAVKYGFTRNLVAHAGYNAAISRPGLNAVSGFWNIDEVNRRVTTPNAGLLPEESNNYMARLEYYFEPVGRIAIGGFLHEFTNLREQEEFTAEEFGYGNDPTFAGYTFITQSNSSETRKYQGFEVEYRQQFSFLPRPLDGLGMFANFTRTVTDSRRPGVTPKRLSTGISYRIWRLNLSLNSVWDAKSPWRPRADLYRREQVKFDASGSIRLPGKRDISLFFQGRNITNVPLQVYSVAPGAPAVMFWDESWGAFWTFGIKGTF